MLALLPLLGGIGLVVGLMVAIANGSPHVSALMVAGVGALVMGLIAKPISTDEDRSWLPTWIMAAYTAKILASWARWWVLVDYYGGSGDAVGYYGKAIDFVHDWRAFSPPPMKIGTEAMEGLGGLIFFFYVPNYLGGFFMYATLAFVGQLFLYAAFRTTVTPRRLKLYAAAVFFVPTVVYWPSSIGKESIMLLGIGMASFGVSRLLNRGALDSLLVIGAGLGIAGIIRPHVSAMLAFAATVALLFAKGEGVARFPGRRLLLLGFVGAGLGAMILVAAANFNINFSDSDVEGRVDDFVATVENQTSGGGSAVDGGFIRSPLEVPEATLRVLFRPFPYEAHNPPALASSLEGTLMLLLVVWKLPAMLRRGMKIRRDPYILYCLVFTILFIFAFSSFLNLGLMARERSQVVPLLLAMVVALGFGPPPEAEEDAEADTMLYSGAGPQDLALGSET